MFPTTSAQVNFDSMTGNYMFLLSHRNQIKVAKVAHCTGIQIAVPDINYVTVKSLDGTILVVKAQTVKVSMKDHLQYAASCLYGCTTWFPTVIDDIYTAVRLEKLASCVLISCRQLTIGRSICFPSNSFFSATGPGCALQLKICICI